MNTSDIFEEPPEIKDSESWAEYYASQLACGQEYQDHIMKVLYHLGTIIQPFSSQRYQYAEGESIGGYEIKLDKLLATKGNLWIEIAEKSKPTNQFFYPSGIFSKHKPLHYLIGDYDQLFMFTTQTLQLIHRGGTYLEKTNRFGTSKGFLFPSKVAKQHAYGVLYIKEKHIARFAPTGKEQARTLLEMLKHKSLPLFRQQEQG